MSKLYSVKRPQNTVNVAILSNMSDGTFSFVNLTEGHICKCRFNSEEEAIADMDKQVELGNVISYKEITNIILGSIPEAKSYARAVPVLEGRFDTTSGYPRMTAFSVSVDKANNI
jgi:hypothetical protein